MLLTHTGFAVLGYLVWFNFIIVCVFLSTLFSVSEIDLCLKGIGNRTLVSREIRFSHSIASWAELYAVASTCII